MTYKKGLGMMGQYDTTVKAISPLKWATHEKQGWGGSWQNVQEIYKSHKVQILTGLCALVVAFIGLSLYIKG